MENQDYFRLCREALGITLQGQPLAHGQTAPKGLYRIMFHVQYCTYSATLTQNSAFMDLHLFLNKLLPEHLL